MFAVQQRYLAIVQDRGFRLPERYLDLMPQVDRIAEALAVRRRPTVPCNNDLLAANLIDDGQRLWVIDYEYGGNNDPCFELGNIWSESTLSLGHLEVLVDSYYGKHLRHKVARARLLGLMSRYGWTLWASIQTEVSPIAFDFWSWGMEKYELALAEFDGPTSTACWTRPAAPTEPGRRATPHDSLGEGLDDLRVDVVLGPGEPLLRRDLPPDDQNEQGTEGDDRRVVHVLELELVAERVCARMNGIIRYTDTMTISATAIGFIHLYFDPLVQLPASKFSPCRQRSQIGMANAR